MILEVLPPLFPRRTMRCYCPRQDSERKHLPWDVRILGKDHYAAIMSKSYASSPPPNSEITQAMSAAQSHLYQGPLSAYGAVSLGLCM